MIESYYRSLEAIHQETEEIYYDKMRRKNRHLKYPAIYKHFKHTEEKPMLYAVSNVSHPVNTVQLAGLLADGQQHVIIKHTEQMKDMILVWHNGKYFHDSSKEEGMLVVYTAMRENLASYGRPIDMFLSEVDKKKYPDVKQRYRLELA